MGERQNEDPLGFDPVDEAVRETAHLAPTALSQNTGPE